MTSTREPVEKTVEENIPGGRRWNRWTNPSPPFPRFFFSLLKLNLFYKKFHHRSHRRPTRYQWTTGGSVPRSTGVPRHSSRYHPGAKPASGGPRKGGLGGLGIKIVLPPVKIVLPPVKTPRLILCTITQLWYNKRVGDPTNNEEIEMNNVKARELIDQLAKNAIECGKQRNNGDVCYAYSYGFFSSSMQGLMEDLNLTKKQMATLQEFVDYSQRRG